MSVIEVHLLDGYQPEDRRRLSESLIDTLHLVDRFELINAQTTRQNVWNNLAEARAAS